MDFLKPEYQADESNRSYAFRALRLNIMTLRLAPGMVLNEKELAEQWNMSRTPIHEALTALSNEWLVEIQPQRNTRVSRIHPSLVKEGYDMRLFLESRLLQDSAGRIGRSQAQQLMACLSDLDTLQNYMPDAIDQYIQLDDRFHSMIYCFGGRSYTWQAVRGLFSHYDRMRYLDALEEGLEFERISQQYREFCDYLMMGLPDNVDPFQKVRAHLTSFQGNLLNKMEQYPDYFTLDENLLAAKNGVHFKDRGQKINDADADIFPASPSRHGCAVPVYSRPEPSGPRQPDAG